MDLLSQSWQLFLDWFENISLLVLLVLLYNYIPDRFFIRRDRIYSVYVGLIFTFAAIMGIFIPWGGTSQPSIGINGILVPLAGMVGGPVSAALITGALLLTRIPFNSPVFEVHDTLIIITAGIVGTLFYVMREKRIVRLDPVIELILLSSLFALISGIILTFISQGRPPGAPDFTMLPPPVLEIAGIIFIGLFILGSVIRTIDRKKDSEFELLTYKEHLEALVQERTADLERLNSLKEATIESTADGIVVIGLQGEVKTLNSAGAFILGIEQQKDGFGEYPDINTLLHNRIQNPDCFFQYREKIAEHTQEPVKTDLTFRSGRTYELSVTPHQLAGEIIGKVCNFRDITNRIVAEEAIKNTNQKLLLLSGITRHDILNQITALNLYLQLVLEEITDFAIKRYLEKMEKTLHTMQLQIKFTSDYQDVGLHTPVWQNPETVFINATGAFQDKGITFSSSKIEYDIYTDPLLERAFYNLIDNSIRHGERVSSISLSYYPDGDDLVLVYSDNGTGVIPEEKDKIFKKGFGKHTGFGMFLIHEILLITGLSIRENGLYGDGVRFEIRIPAGKYRSPS